MRPPSRRSGINAYQAGAIEYVARVYVPTEAYKIWFPYYYKIISEVCQPLYGTI